MLIVRRFAQVTFADKPLGVDDEAADLLLEYAALMASRGSADTADLVGKTRPPGRGDRAGGFIAFRSREDYTP
jgi:hypothetical protein